MKQILRNIVYRFLPPSSGYKSLSRADEVYREAFRKCFEYIDGNMMQGDIFEFGTLGGYTANIIADMMNEFKSKSHLYLFDSFEGLPEITSEVDRFCYEVAINKSWYKGQMNVPKWTVKNIEHQIAKKVPITQLTIVKGYFEETLDEYLPKSKAVLIHVDCDLYASTKFVLDKIVEKDLLQDGCIIMFDDWNCNRANNNMGERKALVDAKINCSLFFSYGWHGQVFFVHK